jgi:GIY-YIG catalytic domain
MKNQSGIYMIQSKIKPTYFYIGSAVNLTSRWHVHLWNLQRNSHHSVKLQNHVNNQEASICN